MTYMAAESFLQILSACNQQQPSGIKNYFTLKMETAGSWKF